MTPDTVEVAVVAPAELPGKDWAEIERRARATRTAGMAMVEGGTGTFLVATLPMALYADDPVVYPVAEYGVAAPAITAAVTGMPLALVGSMQEAHALRKQGFDATTVPAWIAWSGVLGTLAWSAVPLFEPSLAEPAGYAAAASAAVMLYTLDLQLSWNCRAAGLRRGFAGIGCQR